MKTKYLNDKADQTPNAQNSLSEHSNYARKLQQTNQQVSYKVMLRIIHYHTLPAGNHAAGSDTNSSKY